MTEKSHTALVVDDRQEILALMLGVLSGEGFEVMVAENGREALELAEENPPEICVVNSRLSDMDGHELCRQFKENSALETIPILIMLTTPATSEIEECFESGAADVLTTPLHAPVIVVRVRSQIRLRECLSETNGDRSDLLAESSLSSEAENLDAKEETILVVDDDSNNRKLLSVILKKAGYRVVEAVDGQDTLDKVHTVSADLVLLDIMMPRMDGYEACQLLQEDPRTRDIPVIFLSAKTETRDKIKGLEAGGADYVTKPFDRGEVLARVRSQLRIRNLTREVRRKQEYLDADLEAAAGIQKSLLPGRVPGDGVLEVSWKFQPCDMIGGDIFNFFRLDEWHYGFYILDVSGHGVPSALVAVSASQMLQPHMNTLVKRDPASGIDFEVIPPSEVLQALDREYPMERFDKYFTLVYVLIDTKTSRLTYSNAGHPYPLLFDRDGNVRKLEKGGPIIGLGGILPFEEGEVFLNPGDRLFLYTDGVLEYERVPGDFYGEDRFKEVIENSRKVPLDTVVERVMEDLAAFGEGAKSGDDITLLGIEYRGRPGQG